ncbi:MAG: T9SS type A sorting domain-containing protein [Candidatus Krumholzibacteria bacterium]
MPNRPLMKASALLVLLVCIAAGSLAISKELTKAPLLPVVVRALAPAAVHASGESTASGPGLSAVAIDTFTIVEFTFDAPGGGPDPQGWVSRDATDQELYFHVDNFVNMLPPYSPLAGSQSMWLGVRPSASPPLCNWVAAPGYGNGWRQELKSVDFPVTGDVSVDYLVRWDSEASYDFTFFQYRSGGGGWTNLPVNGGVPGGYDGTGSATESFAIPAANHSGTIQFRFYFSSDGAVSDEDNFIGIGNSDGALVVDDLVVGDGSGVVDTQDFESEAVGATQTTDGDWAAGVPGVFGDHSALFNGLSVLQEGVIVNNTNFWGFFENSPDNYGCGGFAAQLAVPRQQPTNDLNFQTEKFLINEIWSPVISLLLDENGTPMSPSAPTFVEFDVYRDIVSATGVRYTLRARSFVDGCPTPWRRTSDMVGTEKDWVQNIVDISTWIDPAATNIQIAFRCEDRRFHLDPCHSHSPLFDNVRVKRISEIPTGIGDTPQPTALHQNHPNPFNPSTTIQYSIASPSHVDLRVYSVAGALVRTLVDADQVPRNGGYAVVWDGRDDGDRQVATGVYFYRLQAAGVSETRKMVLLK